jgi:hypothetical protein
VWNSSLAFEEGRGYIPPRQKAETEERSIAFRELERQTPLAVSESGQTAAVRG